MEDKGPWGLLQGFLLAGSFEARSLALLSNTKYDINAYREELSILYNFSYMLETSFVKRIEKKVQEYWDKEILTASFIDTAQGSEIGHRIADLASDKTTGLLAVNFTAMFQRDRRGTKVPRSMGDIWLHHNDIYHPVNVKTSIATNGGQPNMVSLKKLLGALLEYRIDSYYLLFIKIGNDNGSRRCKIHMVDMLDYLDYVTFDSGPGQMMLKSNAFFNAREQKIVPENKPLKDKVQKLISILEDGERRLVTNRAKKLTAVRSAASLYDPTHHIVTPELQTIFNLQ